LTPSATSSGWDQAALRAYHARLGLNGAAPEFLRTPADALKPMKSVRPRVLRFRPRRVGSYAGSAARHCRKTSRRICAATLSWMTATRLAARPAQAPNLRAAGGALTPHPPDGVAIA
jgi:hypothetical protein